MTKEVKAKATSKLRDIPAIKEDLKGATFGSPEWKVLADEMAKATLAKYG